MRRSGSLFGLLGLLFLAFGFVGTFVIERPLHDPYVVLNLIAGGGLLLAYLSFGFEEFRSLVGQRSTRYGAGALVYTLLFVLLVVGGNYISARRHHRWDLTEAGIYTLAPQSKKVVEALKEDLAMTGFVEGGQDPQLQSLLESYQYAAPGHVKVRIVDPDKEPALVEQMKITTAPSVNLQYRPRRPSPTASSASPARARSSSTSPRATARPTSRTRTTPRATRAQSSPSSRRTTR